MATSSVVADFIGLFDLGSESEFESSLDPNPPNITFNIDLFIALVIILVRIIPEAPTKDPAIINILLCNTNPVAAAANPE